MQWWQNAVVYQIYPRSFADSNGDGIGDLRGIIGKLDYLAALGVDAIWLSPVYASPQDDNGYDISDYQAIDPTFGTMADFDELLAGAHQRGIRIVMDLVVNHTSDEHEWFHDSRRGGDKADWYIWRPGRDGGPPFNHGSFFSGSAWEYDEVRGEYYLHLFSRKQPDLNWENPEVRQAVYAMMRWWLDKGVDGFRMDVINLISKPELADGPLDPGQEFSNCGFSANGPRVHEYLAEMHREVFAGRDLMTVGETPGVSTADARAYTDPARAEVNMVFQFEHMGLDSHGSKWDLRPLELPELKANLARWQDALAEVGWNSLYFNNHDQPRVVSRWGDPEHREASAKTIATTLHLMRGTPYVYQGEELGMTNAGFTSIEQYRDIEALRAYDEAIAAGVAPEAMLHSLSVKSRDNSRTPMQWDASRHAGFTTGEPWLPVTANYVEINAAAQMDDDSSVFAHYRRLIALRHDHEVVRFGRFDLLAPDHERLFAFTRTLGDERVLVVANWSSEPLDLPAELRTDGEVLVTTHAASGPLAAWESRVVRLSV